MKYKKQNEILEDGSLILAPYSKRIFSFIIDVVLLTLLYILLEIIFQVLGFHIKKIKVESFTHIEFDAENLSAVAKIIIQSILVSIPTLYFTLTIFFLNGQTLGKKLFKIKVVSVYHKKLGFWHCLERSLGYVASTLEFGLGFLQAIWNHNRMTLHDKIAETIVIKTEKISGSTNSI
ncbi:MAG: RDD family protein [Ferruginibacter sp.]